MRLWYNRETVEGSDRTNELENTITLSEAFYAEIQQHGIPVERRVVTGLSNAPGALDLYTWLAWRTWTLGRASARIPLLGPGGLCEQLGTAEYAREHAYREKLNLWLSQVRLWWPRCPASICPGGHHLVVTPTPHNHAVPDLWKNR
jgi:Plasmid encoded RepA protein